MSQEDGREAGAQADSRVRVRGRMARHRDALSNVLFISVEQSLPVYPEDISSLVALCTQCCTPLPRAST